MAEVIAKRYARALFNASKEKNLIDKYFKEINDVNEILKNKTIKRIFLNKSIYIKQKMNLMDVILKDFDADIVNFIKLIIEKHRETILDDIIYEFKQIYMDYNGIVDANVISAHPLDVNTLEKIKMQLENNFGKKVNINPSIDESIIGGLKIIIGNRVIDGTIRGKLDKLLKNLEKAI